MSETNIWKFIEDGDLSGYTFIVTSVAVGNVGQLACDLLISSLDMVKIASVYSPALIPVVGYDPYDLKSSKLSTCCEIYKCASKNLVVLQLRAPIVYKYAREFLEEVVKKFTERNIKDIIILSSSFAHENRHISTSPFRFVASNSFSLLSKVKSLDWMEHEKRDKELKIYGGGFATLLYEICEENSLPCLILFKYCSEGNNIPDAYEMVSHLASLLPLFPESSDLTAQLIEPVSWKFLFGSPPPQDIY
ncbi:proteasome assembly chaperone 2 [Ostrinia nubilalis]|uniref:proteasome assembly chaperone 2 n=1 Tax=Ostrinia furnacalis TaxID=93504 RepID=UPI00103F1DB9|nr:proteasome assembly chaperone 2 [Ostrinia furnacalis]